MRPHRPAEEDEQREQFLDARLRGAEKGGKDDGADPTVELLPVACIRQKMSGNRKSPREPANVKTRPTSSSRLTITSINDRSSRQVLRQGYRAQK